MKPNASEEQVLVVPTSRLQEAGIFQGLSTHVDRYLPHLLDPGHLTFRPRSQMESDPNFKQIIPYVILKWRDQLFHYQRGQGTTEKRLRALRSVGVGGHINPADRDDADHPYRQGMLRELAEEIFLDSTYQEQCLGLINDDSTPVGQVHLGIVHLLELAEPRVRRREQGLVRSGFAPLAELRQQKNDFETWSQFVLEALP